MPSQLYRGIHFGRVTAKRMAFSGKDGPGPGEYEPYDANKTGIEHANMVDMPKTSFQSKLPRYHEIIVEQESKKVRMEWNCHKSSIKFLVMTTGLSKTSGRGGNSQFVYYLISSGVGTNYILLIWGNIYLLFHYI